MMSSVSKKENNGSLIIVLEGKVDSGNALQVEMQINDFLKDYAGPDLTLDCLSLEYISSAGLRNILRLRKRYPGLKIINASSEVYEILEMTGFTEMMPVEKAYRSISIEGCEVIGRGSNGVVYRTDPDTVVKVYRNPDSLDEIRHEREVARKALILGIPTAISYDIVRVGDSYATMFELVDAKSFTKLINENPEKIDEYIGMMTGLLKQIHSTAVKKGELPDQKKKALSWVEWLHGHLPEDQYEKLHALIEAVPENDHMIHGDYHTKNVMLQGDEMIMIDMDTLCVGDPVFEFAPIYLAYTGFGELDHQGVSEFIGIPWDTAQYFREKFFRLYLGTDDEEKIKEAEDKARLLGQVRLLRRTLKRHPENTAQIELSRKMITELLERVESLAF